MSGAPTGNHEGPPPDPVGEEENEEHASGGPPQLAESNFDVLDFQPGGNFKVKPGAKAEEAGGPSNAPVPEGGSFVELYEQLLDKELSIEMTPLTAGEYLVVIFVELIQGRYFEGRLSVVRALEKCGVAPALVAAASISNSLAEEEYGAAVRELNTLQLDEAIRVYTDELERRLVANGVRRVQNAYATITKARFAESIGISPQKADEILRQLEWPVAADEMIEPKKTPAFQRFLAAAHDSRFDWPEEADKKTESAIPTDLIKRLVQYADVLDR
ncbi:hypothetical protein M3Y99_01918700 [Aphelenchoides fujianensis]|nr:hypothetical protein M3Y99_01918700 [Aphelenchoides fujianensis]